MLIDCDTCRMREVACADCVVSLLLGAPDATADLDAAEVSALTALAGGGLSPPLRLVPVRPNPGVPNGPRRAHRGRTRRSA